MFMNSADPYKNSKLRAISAAGPIKASKAWESFYSGIMAHQFFFIMSATVAAGNPISICLDETTTNYNRRNALAFIFHPSSFIPFFSSHHTKH